LSLRSERNCSITGRR